MGKIDWNRNKNFFRICFCVWGKRARLTTQKTTTSGSFNGSLPKDGRRTGNGIQEGKELNIREIPASLSETIHQ